MRASDIISRCDTLKPNEYPYALKKDWLCKIESDIREYMSSYSDVPKDNFFASDENPNMLLGESEANIYVYYLISMIDLSNQEYALYNNSSAFFNDALRTWQKKYRRHNLPNCQISIKV